MIIKSFKLILYLSLTSYTFSAEQNFIEYKEPIKHLIDITSDNNSAQPLLPKSRVSFCTKISTFFSSIPAKIKYRIYSCLSKRSKCTDAVLKILPVTPIAIDASCAYALYSLSEHYINGFQPAAIGLGFFLPRAIYDTCKPYRIFDLAQPRLTSTTLSRIYCLINYYSIYILYTVIKKTIIEGPSPATCAITISFGCISLCTCCCLPCWAAQPRSLKYILRSFIKLPLNALIIFPYNDFKNGLEKIINNFIASQEMAHYIASKECLPQFLRDITNANPDLIKIILEYAKDIETEVIEHFVREFEQSDLSKRPQDLLQLIGEYAQNEPLTEEQELRRAVV